MDRDNMDELQQKLLQLQGDIRILEKQRTDILSELERLQSLRQTEITQYKDEIKTLKQEKDALGLQTYSLKKRISMMIEDIQTMQEGVDSYKDAQTDKIRQDLERQKQEAKNLVDLANKTRVELEEKQKEIAAQNESLEIEKQLIKESRDEMAKQNLNIEEKLSNLVTQETNFKSNLASMKEKWESLATQIEDRQRALQSLDETIKTRENAIKSKELEVDTLLQRFNSSQSENEKKAQNLDEREVALTQKEAWIADREKTLSKAYDFIVSKGGQVNV